MVHIYTASLPRLVVVSDAAVVVVAEPFPLEAVVEPDASDVEFDDFVVVVVVVVVDVVVVVYAGGITMSPAPC